MKRVGFEISRLCEMWPIVIRNNKVSLFAMMTDIQIERNIKALQEVLGAKHEKPNIRAVK